MNKSGLNPADFEGTVDGKEVKLYVLTNKNGAEATIINYGAKIVSLLVPDRDGKLVDVVLGHKSLNDYLNSEEPTYGAVCGRVANRIAKGKFTLEGKEYQLAINNGPNSLHGGIKGFQAVVWDAKQEDENKLVLTYLSKDGEEGYPGNLKVRIIYHLNKYNQLKVKYEAETDQTTIVNLTNHSYFNLSGEGDPSVLDHRLTMYAGHYLPTDSTAIPYGQPDKVAGTPFDFTTEHTIGERIDAEHQQITFGKGYDHCYVLDKFEKDEQSLAVKCISPKTGIIMEIYTSEPGVQIYTANWLPGKQEGKNGHYYPERSAVCFETQHFPDSINQPSYPSIVLKPGELFVSYTDFCFSAE